MSNLIIELCPLEPRAEIGRDLNAENDSTLIEDLLDCTGSGDAEDSCKYVLDTHKPEFIIADRSNNYERRAATGEEIAATCNAIYFDSVEDFTDSDVAAVFLIWECAHNVEREESA